MNGVLQDRIFWWGLETPPLFINLNNGVATCETKG